MAQPLVTRLPDTTKALERKYAENPGLADPTSPIANALALLDVQRTQRGQQPLSVRQHTLAALAASRNAAVTPPPDEGIFKDFVRNVRELTSAIPRLPHALYQEVRSLPDLPGAASAALGQGNPVDILAGLGNAPGLRMLPGAFIAGNLNNPGNLWDNPLFTALDVLPIKQAPIVRQGARQAKGAIAGTKAGQMAAQVAAPIGDAWRTSKPGQLMSEAFGTQARDLSELLARKNREVNDLIHGTKDTTDPLAQTARRAATLHSRFPGIDEARRTELTRIMQEDADTISRLTPDEQAFVSEIRDITDQLGHYAVNEQLLGLVDGEFYDAKTASKILGTRRKRVIAEDFQASRNAAISGGTPDDLLQSMRDILTRTDLKLGAQTKLIQGYAHGLEAAGFDAREIFSAIRDTNKSRSTTALSDAIDSFSHTPITARTMADLETVIKAHAKTDPMAARILDHMKAGRWKEARGLAKRVAVRKKFPIPGIDEVVERAEILRNQDKFLKTTSKFDDARVAKLAKISETTEQRAVPARFMPRLQRDIANQIEADTLTKFSTDPNLPEIMTALRERNYGWLKAQGYVDDVEFQRINDEVMEGWQSLKASGYDPVFVHHMGEQSINSLKHPRVLEHIPTPASVRTRINDFTPYLDDVSIALPKQALDFLVRRGSDEFITEMTNVWGRSQNDVLQDYIPAARQIAKSEREVIDVAQRLMDKEWQTYRSTNIINFGPVRLSQWADENNIVLPKTIANNIQRMHTPPGGRISALMDRS
jgi:hypothetical protein